MKIYNTLSKHIEDVTSLYKDNKVGFYACGPTVYDYAHLGHFRRYLMDDVLRRVLKQQGFEVTYVMNITDVGHLVTDADTGEDKVEKAAREKKMTASELAKMYEADFWLQFDRLGIAKPNIVCRATEHITEQIEQIKQLEKKGFVYEIPGDGLYFDTSKDPSYGELAGLSEAQLRGGARVEVVKGKRQAADFALWKFSPANEQRQMEWDSPWGKGFPGWHIECSAMSTKYLGSQFDIHSGGIDHIPVHHTNEIAQAENATGRRPFVRYWVHHNFLRVEGQKMSKSLGNFLRLDDVLDREISPMSLRLLFYSAHYRDELNFTWDSLAAAQKGYEKLSRKCHQLSQTSEWETWEAVPLSETAPLEDEVKKLYDQFLNFLTDDLKVPQALAIMWKTLKLTNQPSALPALKSMLVLLGITVLSQK